MRWLCVRSVFGKGSKGLLCTDIPAHSFYRILPSALHALQGIFVRFIATCDHFLQVGIFRLNDLISGVSMELDITRATHLATRHRFHEFSPPFTVYRRNAVMVPSMRWSS